MERDEKEEGAAATLLVGKEPEEDIDEVRPPAAGTSLVLSVLSVLLGWVSSTTTRRSVYMDGTTSIVSKAVGR